MDDVMDLYDRLPPTDMLSLEEMIERDMRSEHFESDCGFQRHHFECGGEFEDSMMNAPPSGGRLESSDLFSFDDIDEDRNDLPWFNCNGNVDFDPRTVLVNPNTGLRAADETNRSDSGEESLSRPLFMSVKPSLVECDDSIKTVKVERRQFANNRNRLFIRNGGNYFKIDKDVDSSETETSDDDDDVDDTIEKEEELKCEIDQRRSLNEDRPKTTKPFSSTNRTTKAISNGPIGRSPLPLTAEHAQLDRGPCAARVYPKPAYSYSCLIAIALKNSQTGYLPVSEIYTFMIKTFPYFLTAPVGWKNSVRHNLSLNKCFKKIENGTTTSGSNLRKGGCLWGLNPNKAMKMDEEVQKCNRKDPTAIRKSMARPELLELLEKGVSRMEPTDLRLNSKVEVTTTEEEPTTDVNVKSKEDFESEEESFDSIDFLQVN